MKHEEKIQMVEMIRSEQMSGRPEVAQKIKKALDNDEFYLGPNVEPVEEVEAPAKNASVGDWREFAKKVSNIEPEIIDSEKRKVIQDMMKANGFIK